MLFAPSAASDAIEPVLAPAVPPRPVEFAAMCFASNHVVCQPRPRSERTARTTTITPISQKTLFITWSPYPCLPKPAIRAWKLACRRYRSGRAGKGLAVLWAPVAENDPGPWCRSAFQEAAKHPFLDGEARDPALPRLLDPLEALCRFQLGQRDDLGVDIAVPRDRRCVAKAFRGCCGHLLDGQPVARMEGRAIGLQRADPGAEGLGRHRIIAADLPKIGVDLFRAERVRLPLRIQPGEEIGPRQIVDFREHALQFRAFQHTLDLLPALGAEGERDAIRPEFQVPMSERGRAIAAILVEI